MSRLVWLAALVLTPPVRVKEILLGIAAAQPLVLANATVPAPTVPFLGFGDSALNLELRFFVRDINQRLTVLSEVNSAIDAAFREAGVEIPFPQRDLHLRSAASTSVNETFVIHDRGDKTWRHKPTS